MNIYSTGAIRRDLANLMGGSICHETWKEWRKSVTPPVTGHKCTYDQWVQLCAALALHKRGRKVATMSIKVFIRDHGDDPMAFMPGLLPIDVPKSLPQYCKGSDLPDLIFQWLGVVRSEDTIALWCKKAGITYSRGLSYGRDEILAIVYQCARAKSNKRLKALENLKKTKSSEVAA